MNMSGFEVQPSVVRKIAQGGWDNVDELGRHTADFAGQQLSPEGFPLAAGREFVDAYHHWLHMHAETIRDEAAGWEKTFANVDDARILYGSVDQSRADEMREFFS